MTISIDITDLVNTLKKFSPGKPLKNFIGEATFPNFKGLAPGSKITFEFPLTAIVGPNGSGKSSILHALWGMPLKQSTSRFWFSTAVDPIAEGGEHGVPRYHYKHWINELNQFVQTKKVRVGQKKGYWETARASTRDGMARMPHPTQEAAPFRSADRWAPTARKVKYINFKCEFSAFDRIFYFADRSQTLEQRQDDIARDAEKLARVIDKKLQSYKPGGHQAVFENRELTPKELEWICYVLGREYVSARYVLHRLYGRIEAPTVVFRRSNLTYSEAFAGSGELAVVRAVIETLNCPQYTLLLLDEPETSLHPGAQKRFMGFLLEMIKTKHMQVVMSTHSPTFVNLLPSSAIRTLEEDPKGKTQIIAVNHPEAAFNVLGHQSNDKITVVVEDALLTSLVKLAARQLSSGDQSVFSFHTPAAGADNILTYDIPGWISEKRNVFVILDGDQNPGGKLDFGKLTDVEKSELEKIIFDRYKVRPLHVSNDNVESGLNYLKWVEDRVHFLSSVCPEQVLLEQLIGEDEARTSMPNNQLAKKNLVEALEAKGHPTDALALSASVSYIIPNFGCDNNHIKALAETLREIIKFDAAKKDCIK